MGASPIFCTMPASTQHGTCTSPVVVGDTSELWLDAQLPSVKPPRKVSRRVRCPHVWGCGEVVGKDSTPGATRCVHRSREERRTLVITCRMCVNNRASAERDKGGQNPDRDHPKQPPLWVDGYRGAWPRFISVQFPELELLCF